MILNKAIYGVINVLAFIGKLVRSLFKDVKWREILLELKVLIQRIKFLLRKEKKQLQKRKKLSKRKKVISRFTIFLTGILFSIVFLSIPFQIYFWYRQLPSIELLDRPVNESTKILDSKGRLLYEIFIEKKQDPVEIEKIPDNVIKATLAIEDHEFYYHRGIRLESMLRALRKTVLEGKVQGGSTLTQQLVKNVLLSPEQTLSRKVREIVLAILVERNYTKDEILELYLNNTPYGGNAWGIQSASLKFFGKDVLDLNLAEASMLAGLPSAPSRYSPVAGNFDLAKLRQGQVLDRMTELSFVTKEEAQKAYEEELKFVPQVSFIRAPHFVNYVQNELIQMYGRRFVELGGLTVITSLDLDLQDQIQEIVRSQVEQNRSLNLSNGAAVVLDSKSGNILAYIGSVDFFSTEIDGKFDVVTAFRQPGSSIKPVTYSLAFGNGYTVASVINDSPVTIQTNGKTYSPRNYDGKFHGKVTLRQALANSYNVVAVKLVRALGPDNMVQLGGDLGLRGWKVDSTYGFSVTLGGKEVRLLDLTNVYATLSRGGSYKDTSPFISIRDSNGFELYRRREKEEQVIDSGVAYLITHILSDKNARIPAFGTSNWLSVSGHTIAVKTGTTDEKRDNWTFGYTPTYVVGVWVGNNDNSPMHPYLSSGLSGASPIWNEIMLTLLRDLGNEQFEVPDNIVVKVDPECNFKGEIFIKGTEPRHLCDLSKTEKKDRKK